MSVKLDIYYSLIKRRIICFVMDKLAKSDGILYMPNKMFIRTVLVKMNIKLLGFEMDELAKSDSISY